MSIVPSRSTFAQRVTVPRCSERTIFVLRFLCKIKLSLQSGARFADLTCQKRHAYSRCSLVHPRKQRRFAPESVFARELKRFERLLFSTAPAHERLLLMMLT